MSELATHITAFFSGFTVAMLCATWDLRKLRRELAQQERTKIFFSQHAVPVDWTLSRERNTSDKNS